jgi:hypothetical protein
MTARFSWNPRKRVLIDRPYNAFAEEAMVYERAMGV